MNIGIRAIDPGAIVTNLLAHFFVCRTCNTISASEAVAVAIHDSG